MISGEPETEIKTPTFPISLITYYFLHPSSLVLHPWIERYAKLPTLI